MSHVTFRYSRSGKATMSKKRSAVVIDEDEVNLPEEGKSKKKAVDPSEALYWATCGVCLEDVTELDTPLISLSCPCSGPLCLRCAISHLGGGSIQKQTQGNITVTITSSATTIHYAHFTGEGLLIKENTCPFCKSIINPIRIFPLSRPSLALVEASGLKADKVWRKGTAQVIPCLRPKCNRRDCGWQIGIANEGFCANAYERGRVFTIIPPRECEGRERWKCTSCTAILDVKENLIPHVSLKHGLSACVFAQLAVREEDDI